MKRIPLLVSSLILGASAYWYASSALAIGRLADIQITDRTTGQTLPIYNSGGNYYVAGKPGSRYAVTLRNRLGERVLSVISIDGINAVSGETANWDQTGYVLGQYSQAEISGWRKSMSRIAAFEFAALQNSYAARTGRPDNVGVIGVAIFREKMVPYLPWNSPRGRIERDEATSASAKAASPATESESRSANDQAPSTSGRLAAPAAPAPTEKLGTAHGRIETSVVSYTGFERSGSSPDEVISIYYDSEANLIAQGVIPVPIARLMPRPFPVNNGFVPDPPRN